MFRSQKIEKFKNDRRRTEDVRIDTLFLKRTLKNRDQRPHHETVGNYKGLTIFTETISTLGPSVDWNTITLLSFVRESLEILLVTGGLSGSYPIVQPWRSTDWRFFSFCRPLTQVSSPVTKLVNVDVLFWVYFWLVPSNHCHLYSDPSVRCTGLRFSSTVPVKSKPWEGLPWGTKGNKYKVST